jgi:hypothetical protein
MMMEPKMKMRYYMKMQGFLNVPTHAMTPPLLSDLNSMIGSFPDLAEAVVILTSYNALGLLLTLHGGVSSKPRERGATNQSATSWSKFFSTFLLLSFKLPII